ncbi:MAG TPA: selenide, water dikinase SelD, partial [Planctomycetaceae bacterium]|nr:selenide, water dikinase SelD [Planctomycetaceae bacterium]
GAGHTNMHIARMWRMDPLPGVRLTLVSPWSRATYSGMLPGTLAGLYRPDDMEIDLWRFAASCDVRLIVAEAAGLDAARRRVLFEDRPPLRFDVASIGIGSVPAGGEIRRHPQVLSIKPMATFLTRLDEQIARVLHRSRTRPQGSGGSSAVTPRDGSGARLDEDDGGRLTHAVSAAVLEAEPPQGSPADAHPTLRVAVVGGGAAGTEIAFCLDRLLHARSIASQIQLVESGPQILAGYADKTRRLALREFNRRGIDVTTGQTAAEFDHGRVGFESGESLAADLVIWAAGAAPPPELDGFDLPRAEDGFLAVRPTLQSTGHDRVFVVGDTATFVDRRVPKAGVYAVREGPVLWENLRRVFRDEPLEEYDPQKGFLSLLSTGDGRAIAQYRGFAFHNRLMWRWKDYIDRKFMRMYQDYRPMMAADATRRPRHSGGEGPSAAPAMRCKGCGGKVGANVLSAALGRLEIPPSPYALQGLDRPDDAAVLNPAAGAAEVLSVDFFQAFLDDPYLVGRVAALNALSDLWAMGSEPLGAMAMVTLPEGEPRQQTELLYQLLAGGLRELLAAGATLLGGHTTEGSDLTIGYTVVGRLNGRRPTAKGGLTPGDRLVLTKPLGTGTLLAAHMQSRCRAPWMDAMLSSMLESNAAAAGVARECGATAVTDVTGFGLAGHLLEMLDASGVSARISLDALPLLPGFAELAGEGVESTLAPANREIESRMDAAPGVRRDPRFAALFDPQTSGGLLFGLAAEAAESQLRRSEKIHPEVSVVIGEIVAQDGTPQMEIV